MALVVLLMVFLPILTLIIGAMWGRAHERSLWQRYMLQHSGLPDEPRLNVMQETVRPTGGESERLAHAVDAIAVEVERLGEGQRFLTRLMAEREARGAKSTSPQPGTVRSAIPPTT